VNAPHTPAEPTPDFQLEIAHLLLLDVVGYSKLLVEEQVQLIQELTEIVRATECFRNAARNGKLIRVPTGDGMALAFFSSPEEPARCALEISRTLQSRPRIQLRMGIHSGPVNRILDVNEKLNVVGAGINVAQRVLDCGDAGHILLSAHIAEDLAEVGHWRASLHDLGACEVKHGLRLHLFNLYKDGLGNPHVPEKLRRLRPKQTSPLSFKQMHPSSQQISSCPNCGGVLEEIFGGELSCMSCLLRAGIGSEQEAAQDSTPDTFEGGVRFGVYEIDCHPDGSLYELGRGAMGITYRATDTSLQRKVALKIIKTDIAARSADADERFVREARAAAALRHEHIATVYQFGMRVETGQYFYAMELIEGETLDDRVHRAGPLDAGTTIGIAEQVTSVLSAAEKHGLVHRDIKPANLMLVNADTPEVTGNHQARPKRRIRALRKSGIPVVKIIDFGLAKAFHTATDPKSLTHDRFVGTPAFASPEQFEHSALDVRSDIYSLGETLWFALTGKTPFAGRTLSDIQHAQKSNALPFEQLKAAHVPHHLKSLLESMLAFEPASRPGTHELAARLQRCSPETRRTRRTRLALVSAALVALGMSALFVFQPLRIQDWAGVSAWAGIPEKSIAVLPFENLSGQKENIYFADGVQDEILTGLTKVADLKVISRTSTLQYKSSASRNLREIAKALGVAHVLEGTVQRAGGRVRINAQLIDARTDSQVWAERYDRDISDVFAIESEVAGKIVSQLQAEISPVEKAAIGEKPTSDLVAYDLYIHAKTLITASAFSTPQLESLSEGVRLLNEAIERDPNFALAYYQLANAHDQFYFSGIDHTPGRLALADAAIQSLTRLRPNSGEAHLALARHLYWGYLDYDRARRELSLAMKSLPNEATVFSFAGYIDRRQGRWNESTKNLERAAELDPRNTNVLQQLANSYVCLRRYADAERVLDRAIAVDPKDSNTRAFRAAIELRWHADPRPLRSVIETIVTRDPSEGKNIAELWLEQSMCQRDPNEAARALAALPITGCYDDRIPFPRAWCEGIVARLGDDKAAAQSAFTSARTEAAKLVEDQHDYPEGLCVLGMADAALGHKEDAIREGRRAVELLPVTKDSTIGAMLVKNLALIYAWTGEKDPALEQLSVAAKIPGLLSYGELRLHPNWDPLRGDPRFDKIVASLAPK
jgi:serine/threonine protein kinase/tetratricopeptide (TPR) repeat protein